MANSKISALTSATTPLAGTETLPIVQSSTTKQVSVANLTAGRAVATGALTVTGKATTTSDLGVGTTSPNSAGVDRAITVSGTSNAIVEVNYGATRGAYLYANSGVTVLSAVGAAQLKLNTDDTPRIAIQPTTGDVYVLTGNITPQTAAKGINFTANTPQAGMTSQLLNWYEEGTWTGTLAFNGGSTGITYASNTGYYERVGKTVHVSIYVELTSKGSSTGLTTLSGLPFISANNTAAYAAVTIWASGISVTGILEGFVAINSQQIKLYTLSALGVLATLQDTAFTNTSSFMINVSYRTT